MLKVNELTWKRALEGMRRGDVGPFTQQNTVHDSDCCRTYFDGKEPVACMLVLESNSDRHALECEREFLVRQDVVKATAYIYMPTQAEYEAWDERSLDDPDFDFHVELHALDPGWDV